VRIINQDTITALSSDNIYLATLIQLDFPTPIYITDYGKSLTHESQLYVSSSYLIDVGGAKETGGVKVNSMNLKFNSVGSVYSSLVLSNSYINTKVTIQRVCLDANDAVIGEPITYFEGRVIGFEMTDNNSESQITLEIASHWSDFDKIQNRRTNSSSQNFYYPDDKGFDYASSTITTLKWGRE